MARVSVIVPTFNKREQVREALRSVMDQDCGDIEIVIADDGFDSHLIQQHEHAARALQWGQIQIAEGHLKKRQTPYKIKILPAVTIHPCLFGPAGALLIKIAGLQAGDGLKDAVMTFPGKIFYPAGLLPLRTNEFRKVDIRRTARAATATAQAGPDFAALDQTTSRIQYGPFDDLSG